MPLKTRTLRFAPLVGDRRRGAARAALDTVPIFCALLLLSFCGSVGEPLPPLLNIPESSQDLAARQTELGIILQWTWPETTTEGMPFTDLARFAIHFMQATAPRRATPDDFAIQSKWLHEVDVADLDDLGPGDPVQVTLDPQPFLGETLVLGVRAESRRGRSAGFSNLLVIQVLAPPAPPAPPQLTVTADAIELKWPAIPDARSYRIQRRAQDEPEFQPLAITAETTFRDPKFTWDETYVYRVQSLTGSPDYEVAGGTSPPAQIAALDAFPPAAPNDLRVVAGLDSIELSWEPGPESDLAGYRLRRTTDNAKPAVLTPDLIPTINFTDRQVQRGVTYRYDLTALDQNNNESLPARSREVRLP